MFDNVTRSRADTVSTYCSVRPAPLASLRQSLPTFKCGYACGRKHLAAGDSGRGHFHATTWRDPASSHKLTTPRKWDLIDLAEFAKSKARSVQGSWKRRSNMASYLKIETRRAKGQKRCGIPAPSSPFPHRRTQSIVANEAHTDPLPYLSNHHPYASDGRTASCSCTLRCPGNASGHI
jgi:hypothetical protein